MVGYPLKSAIRDGRFDGRTLNTGPTRPSGFKIGIRKWLGAAGWVNLVCFGSFSLRHDDLRHYPHRPQTSTHADSQPLLRHADP